MPIWDQKNYKKVCLTYILLWVSAGHCATAYQQLLWWTWLIPSFSQFSSHMLTWLETGITWLYRMLDAKIPIYIHRYIDIGKYVLFCSCILLQDKNDSVEIFWLLFSEIFFSLQFHILQILLFPLVKSFPRLLPQI